LCVQFDGPFAFGFQGGHDLPRAADELTQFEGEGLLLAWPVPLQVQREQEVLGDFFRLCCINAGIVGERFRGVLQRHWPRAFIVAPYIWSGLEV